MKVCILGNGRRGIGSRLLAALAMGAGWASPLLGGNSAQPVQRVYGAYQPTGAALRNPADPVQAAQIQAAAAKRGRKAAKRHNDAVSTFVNNRAHTRFIRNTHDETQIDGPLSLQTLYIAK
jgi:hypothetical protein